MEFNYLFYGKILNNLNKNFLLRIQSTWLDNFQDERFKIIATVINFLHRNQRTIFKSFFNRWQINWVKFIFTKGFFAIYKVILNFFKQFEYIFTFQIFLLFFFSLCILLQVEFNCNKLLINLFALILINLMYLNTNFILNFRKDHHYFGMSIVWNQREIKFFTSFFCFRIYAFQVCIYSFISWFWNICFLIVIQALSYYQ